MEHMYFLSAKTPFRKRETSLNTFEPAPFQKHVSSHAVVTPMTTHGLLPILKEQASLGRWLCKGQRINRPLIEESRSGAFDVSAKTNLLVIDLDGIHHRNGLDGILVAMGLEGYPYVYQYSSSQKFTAKFEPARADGVHAHVFMVLSGDVETTMIKNWLWRCNLKNSWVKLQDNNDGLKYGADLNMAANSSCILIAPPELQPREHEYADIAAKRAACYDLHYVPCCGGDKMYSGERHQTTRVDVLAEARLVGAREVLRVVNDLRQQAGIPPRDTYKYITTSVPVKDIGMQYAGEDGTEVAHVSLLKNPSLQDLEIAEEARGFFYLRVVGKTDPSYYMSAITETGIISRWSDPLYKAHLKNVCPALWGEILEKWQARKAAGMTSGDSGQLVEAPSGTHSVVHFIRDRDTSKRFVVDCVYEDGALIKVDTTYVSKGMENQTLEKACRADLIGSAPEEGYFEYRPDLPPGVTAIPRPGIRGAFFWIINKYVPPRHEYLADATSVPPFTKAILRHVLGYCDQHYQRMLDWLAYIVQIPKRGDGQVLTQTAWIILGVQGTGKGMLCEKGGIIPCLLGESNIGYRSKSTFLSDGVSTSMMDDKQLFYIDEANTDGGRKAETKFSDFVKTLVTGEVRDQRTFFRDPRSVPNTLNLIMTSNHHVAPVDIEVGDRRYNVPPFQKEKIDDLITRYSERYGFVVAKDRIRLESAQFYNYLRNHHRGGRLVDFEDIRVPIMSPAKVALQFNSVTLSKSIGSQVTHGMWDTVMAAVREIRNAESYLVPQGHRSYGAPDYYNIVTDFRRAVFAIVEHVLATTDDPYEVQCETCAASGVDHWVHTSESVYAVKLSLAETLSKDISQPRFLDLATGADTHRLHPFPIRPRVTVNGMVSHDDADTSDDDRMCAAVCSEQHRTLIPSRLIHVGETPGYNDNQETRAALDRAMRSSKLHGTVVKKVPVTLGTIAPILRHLACANDRQMEDWLDSRSPRLIKEACRRADMPISSNPSGSTLTLFDSATYYKERASARVKLTADNAAWHQGKPPSNKDTYIMLEFAEEYGQLLDLYMTLLELEKNDPMVGY